MYRRFIVAYTQLQRMDANGRSPVLMHLGECHAGAAVLRAFGRMHDFVAHADAITDQSSCMFHTFNSAGRWFAGAQAGH